VSITYPLSLLTHTGIRSISFRAVNSVAVNRSPFTFQSQTQVYSGQMWQADVSLPTMKRADAEQWIAWLLSLNGQRGTFLLGDPLSTAIRGTATSLTVTGSAGDSTVSATVTNGQTLLAGDMFQLGSGSDATMHKVLVAYTGTGSATNLEIWPALRKARSAVAADLTSPQGVFRLASNEQSWDVDEASAYGISFSAVEAV
jgi:hypothetical protein